MPAMDPKKGESASLNRLKSGQDKMGEFEPLDDSGSAPNFTQTNHSTYANVSKPTNMRFIVSNSKKKKGNFLRNFKVKNKKNENGTY